MTSAELSTAAAGIKRVSVIVPTYREVENIPHLVERLDGVRRANGLDPDVLLGARSLARVASYSCSPGGTALPGAAVRNPMEQGNLFAKLALFVWVPVTLALFSRGSAPRATAWSLIGAVLFLPQLINFDLPVIPAFDKQTVAALWALIGCYIWHRRRLRWDRAYRGIGFFLIVYLVGVVCTTLLNGDEQRYGPRILPGSGVYDAVSALLAEILNYAIPFFLARNLYRTRADLLVLVRALVWLGLIYSMLALVEIRLSPQLHNWIYGFHQHTFGQSARGGGFRPMVFMAHGLACAMFMLSTAMVATTFGRAGGRLRGAPGRALGAWLTLVLLLCKSTAAIIYGTLCLPLLAWGRSRAASHLALVLAVVVLVYPGLRLGSLLPIDALVAKAASISDDRSESLSFRLLNEEMLVERARQRLWFGWGGYGRNRVYDASGADIVTTDSQWAICFGSRGLVGYVSFFGLLTAPIFAAARRIKHLQDAKTARLLSGLSLILAVNVFDLLLNGLFSFIPVFLAGALVGAVEGSVVPAEAPQQRRRPLKQPGAQVADVSGRADARHAGADAPRSRA